VTLWPRCPRCGKELPKDGSRSTLKPGTCGHDVLLAMRTAVNLLRRPRTDQTTMGDLALLTRLEAKRQRYILGL
jgi:DNA-directed RNA polymerase subunit RPC12/RpoP